MSRRQRTLKGAARLSGTGLHTGQDCEAIIHPADPGTGIVFHRNGRVIPASIDSVTDTSRSTTIGIGGDSVVTVEHLLAALKGLRVDNAVVELRGPETPALDGSALPYVEAMISAGIVEQSEFVRKVHLSEPVLVTRGEGYILAVPSDRFEINYLMRYDHPMIGSQSFSFVLDEDAFAAEVAPARTFVIYEEVAGLLSQRLAQGGSLDNTIVIWQDHLSCGIRFPDELARHKVLDLIGDLTLLDGDICAEIVAVRSGHALNAELAKRISATAV